MNINMQKEKQQGGMEARRSERLRSMSQRQPENEENKEKTQGPEKASNKSKKRRKQAAGKNLQHQHDSNCSDDLVMSVKELIGKLNDLHTDHVDTKEEVLQDLYQLVNNKKFLDYTRSLEPSEYGMASFDKKSVLGVPFVALPRVQATGAVGSPKSRMTKHMSRNTQTVACKPLLNAYHSNVVFKSYDIDRELSEGDIPNFVGNPPDIQISNAVHGMLQESRKGYQSNRGKQEILQLGSFQSYTWDLFNLFGYEMNVNAPPADDVDFVFDNNKFMVGEGKDVTSLPRGPLSSGLSHHLCFFGFATWLVGHYVVKDNFGAEKMTEVKDLLNELEEKLHLVQSNQDTKEKTSKVELYEEQQLNIYVDALKKIVENDNFDTVVNNVRNALANRKISPQDALQLWAAVVQACFATIPQRNPFTLVMSMDNMWFIMLRVTNGEYQICVSDPVPVGSPGFNLNLLSFLNKVRVNGTMADRDQKKWEEYLTITKAGSDEDDSSKGSGDDAAQKEQTDDGGTGRKCDQANQASSIGEHSVVEQEFMSVDRHGVVVPYFFQIRDEMGVLGGGRCGQVKKIKWRDGIAAKKEYLMDPEDDGRDGDEVFRHERNIYYKLRKLWGRYVPTLLFHKEWPRHSYLGLEVGEPMPHEWEDWSEDENKQADDAIAAVEGLGWSHRDIVARNFVRLSHKDGTTSIALIDFEDASYVGP